MLRIPRHDDPVDIGVFGGSGFYSFVDGLTPVPIETPYGPPSATPMVGTVDGRRIAFLARHGDAHTIPAHRVNFRANVWALAALGAQAVIAPFACGSLRAEIGIGDLVIVDQLVDRTQGRIGTFFDGPETVHLSFADPYDAALGAQLADAAEALGHRVHRNGTVVIISGPRFSTRAESRWHAAQGWDLVNMTQAPEIALIREAGMAAVGVGLVTDFDAGLDGDPNIEPVSEEQVFGYLKRNADVMRNVLASCLGSLTLPS